MWKVTQKSLKIVYTNIMLKKSVNAVFLFALVVSQVVVLPNPVLAQSVSSSRCDSLLSQQNLSESDKAELRICEKQLNDELVEIENQKNKVTGERKSLESDKKLIDLKVAEVKSKIKSTQTTIKKLAGDINAKETKIKSLGDKINQNKEYIAKILADIRKLDDVRAVVALSSSGTFADIFKDFGDYKSLQGTLADNLDGLKTNKKFIEVEKEVLLDKKDETEALKAKQEEDRKEEEQRSKEKKDLIALTKQQEKDYEKILTEKKAKAAAIKSRLFSFAGGNTAAIPFGTALAHAELAQAKTGVPAAFVLAILTQESALGANVGKCYLTNPDTGYGINIKTNAVMKNTMKPTRDVQPFIEITTGLGMDPYKTVISCPIAGVAGWGGAMGPAQFIASTWKSIASRVAAITGTSNPWDAKDSIIASATYLGDLGATNTYLSQIKAACRYYGTGGSNCSYGKQVLARVAKIQNDIDYLKQYGSERQ